MAKEKTAKESDKKKKPTSKGTKKKTSRKKSKVLVPKMTNTYRPEGMGIQEWQIALRKQAAEKETFAIYQVDEKYCPGEYTVANPLTHKEYKIVYRGKDSLWNFCSCFDFKTSQLGTCKHIEAVKLWVRSKHKKIHHDEPTYTSVYVDYSGPRRIRIRIGEDNYEEYEKLAKKFFDDDFTLKESAYASFDDFIQKAKAINDDFRCYDDALDLIIEKREQIVREQFLCEKYSDDKLDSLLSVQLYPYQREGVRFALKAGKAIIADEMGLGKTIQAIASAEIYLREGMAESVLIVCPTSLKYQWKREIEKFTGGDRIESDEDYIEDERICPKVIVIEGNPPKREKLYRARAPYKIVSYHAMKNDIQLHGKLDADILIMDEIQRLKNWNTQISVAARRINSRYSILLSGTPLENKLEELYANMELVDQFCLGPYYLFRYNHILINENGGIAGYKNLNAVGQQIKDKLIRRTKKSVMLQLPKRSNQFLLVPMTQKQNAMHNEFKSDLSMILRKYEKYHFMTEQDRKRMMLLLAQMRMVADSTYILEQNPKTRADIKVDEVMNILNNIFENGDEKVVIFSEWERMTRLIAMELDKRGIRFEYLNGSVPSKQRGVLVNNFTTLPDSRVFLSTDAGSTGLNLQVASTLINLDLPWNPAILEQRIARIYRLGQEKPVQILNLVSQSSIEEGMIGKLRFKTSMFEGVLDGGEDTVFINDDKFKKFMDDISSVMSETPDASTDDAENVSEDEEDISMKEVTGSDDVADIKNDEANTIKEIGETKDTQYDGATNSTSNDTSSPTASATSSSTPTEPSQLINQGLSFFSGLAETLKSPEATQHLVDNIVSVDKNTGETSIKIPVANKETVKQIFSLFSKLIQG